MAIRRRGGGAPMGNKNAAGPHKGKGTGATSAFFGGPALSGFGGYLSAARGADYQRNFRRGAGYAGAIGGAAVGGLYGGLGGLVAGQSRGAIIGGALTGAAIGGGLYGGTNYGAARLGQYIYNVNNPSKRLTRSKRKS